MTNINDVKTMTKEAKELVESATTLNSKLISIIGTAAVTAISDVADKTSAAHALAEIGSHLSLTGEATDDRTLVMFGSGFIYAASLILEEN